MSAAATAAPSLAGHAWWLASRASGIVALVLVTVSVGIGLTLAGKFARRPGLPRILMAIHEQTAVIGLVAIAVHGLTLLGDPWLNPGPAGVAVPFTMAYKPLFTGMGIIAGYLAAILGLSFYIRKRIGPRLWRKAHRATIVVYGLGLAHTIGAGTDASTTWLRAFMVLTAVPILTMFVVRTVQGMGANRKPAPARVPHGRASHPHPATLNTGRPAMGEETA